MSIKSESVKDYDREVLKVGLSSLFWAIVKDRKKRAQYTLADLARDTGRDKPTVSRWFSAPPNWRLDTVADIASALDVDLELRAVERGSGRVFTASGPVTQCAYIDGSPVTSTSVGGISGASSVVSRPSTARNDPHFAVQVR